METPSENDLAKPAGSNYVSSRLASAKGQIGLDGWAGFGSVSFGQFSSGRAVGLGFLVLESEALGTWLCYSPCNLEGKWPSAVRDATSTW